MAKQQTVIMCPSDHPLRDGELAHTAAKNLRPLKRAQLKRVQLKRVQRFTAVRLTGALLGTLMLGTAMLPPVHPGIGPRLAHAKDKVDKKAVAKAAAESLARPMAPVTASQPEGKIMLPEGTRVKLVLLDELKSNKMDKGDVVHYALLEDLKGPNGVILIPKGTSATGVITKAKGAGGLGRKGSLEFTADAITTATQGKVALRSSQAADGKSNGAAVVALSLLISPLALFMKGKNISIAPGEIIEAYISAPTTLNKGAFDNMMHHDVDAITKANADPKK